MIKMNLTKMYVTTLLYRTYTIILDTFKKNELRSPYFDW